MGSLGPRLAASGLRGMVLDDIIPQSELFAGRLYRSREDFSLSGDSILRGYLIEQPQCSWQVPCFCHLWKPNTTVQFNNS